MKIGFVIPHIFMHSDILNDVIFAPGTLGIDLVKGYIKLGHEVFFFTPKYELNIKGVTNINADLSFFEEELKVRGDKYTDLLVKHPLTFITLARQVQTELISKAYEMGNEDKLDVLHFFCNEEEIALPFAKFSKIPVFFTHHEPYNFLTKYRSQFGKYSYLNWISISKSQKKTGVNGMNFVGNVSNGLDVNRFKPLINPTLDYLAYSGRIIEPKGVHLAIEGSIKAGLKIKIAGKHYSESGKDDYWESKIKPYLDNPLVEYLGHLRTDKEKNEFYGNAKCLIVPSVWDEPFGMVIIESLASGTPVIGLNSGAIPEIIKDKVTGYVIDNDKDVVQNISEAIGNISNINRDKCRKEFEENFTSEKMAKEYLKIYSSKL